MKNGNQRTQQSPPDRPLGRCKVCTKQIRAGEGHMKVYHAGTDYLVCCASCATKFEENPGSYLVV